MELFDATIRPRNSSDDLDAVDLWYVVGIPSTYYPTKIAAEIATRQHFPDEDIYKRYGRVNYHRFVKEG